MNRIAYLDWFVLDSPADWKAGRVGNKIPPYAQEYLGRDVTCLTCP